MTSADGWSLFSWVQVSDWLNTCHLAEVELDEDERTLALVDLLSRVAAIAGIGPAVSIDWASRLQGVNVDVSHRLVQVDYKVGPPPFPRAGSPNVEEGADRARS